jgi:hypothetical protein
MYDIPKKERLIVAELRDFIDDDTTDTIALVAGMRKVGKTTVLKQLLQHYGNAAVYIDLSKKIDFEDVMDSFIDGDATVLLLDEISYLRDFEEEAQSLFNLTNADNQRQFKVIITGSSAAHLTKLAITKLGGRAKLSRLPPITFVEYLYFTDRITSYDDFSDISTTDFANYLNLKGLRSFSIQFNNGYFNAFYREVEIGNKQRGLSYSLVDLKSGDLENMAKLLAYKLNEARTYDRTVAPRVGRQEQSNLRHLTPRVKFMQGVDLSDAMVAESSRHVLKVSTKDKARILLFMLNAGLACIEFIDTGNAADIMDTGHVTNALETATTEQDLRHIFDEVSICLITPLLYTRLGVDILKRAGVDRKYLCQGEILGKMFEVYVRGSVALRSERTLLSTIKLGYADIGEVDIFDDDKQLILEATISNKPAKDVYVHKYFTDAPNIRIASTKDQNFSDELYTRLPYPILACMLDTGKINDLPKSLGAV